MKKWILITLCLLLWAAPAWSADKVFNDYTNGTTIADDDELLYWKTVEGDVYNIAWSAFLIELKADNPITGSDITAAGGVVTTDIGSTVQGYDVDLADLANGIMSFFSNPLAVAPTVPVDGKIYCANNEAAGWDPASISGTVDYLVIYDGASYIALVDKDGNWFIKQFQIDGTDDGIADSTFNGIATTGLAGATLAIGDVIYLSDTDGRWELADANSTTAQANRARGVAISTAANDGDAVIIGIKGKLRLDTWTWNDNEGQPLYLSDTAGDLTETRTTSASLAVQVLGYILSDDEIFIDPKEIDYSVQRAGTDADGRTLTCLEATNTIWEATGASTITTPAISACPTISVTITTTGDVAVVVDVNAGDDSIVDGVANADGHSFTNKSDSGDSIYLTVYDADTLIGSSGSLTTPFIWTAE